MTKNHVSQKIVMADQYSNGMEPANNVVTIRSQNQAAQFAVAHVKMEHAQATKKLQEKVNADHVNHAQRHPVTEEVVNKNSVDHVRF